MKVYEKNMNGMTNFYLSESRFFPSLIDLVSCYEQTSLGENFMGYVRLCFYLVYVDQMNTILRFVNMQ